MNIRRETIAWDKLSTSAGRIQSQKRIKSSIGSRKTNFNEHDKTLFQEVTRLEEKLDKQEIALQNYLKSASSQPDKELEIYKEFLQGVAYYTKQKNPELGSCILRGLQGICKAYAKSKEQQRNSREELSKPALVSQSCQVSEPPKPKIPFEYELALLKEKLNKIEFADLTSQLTSVHENLKNLYIELPSPTEPTSDFTLDFNELSHMISSALKLIKPEKPQTVIESTPVVLKKLTTDRGVQVIIPNYEIQHYTSLLRDKEIEILNLNKSVEKIRRENTKAQATESTMLEINKQRSIMERKERSLQAQAHVECEKSEKMLKDKIGRRNNNIHVYKRMVKDLNKKNLEKVFEVEKLNAENIQNKLQLYQIAKTHSIDISDLSLENNDFLAQFEDDVTGEYIKRMKRQLLHSAENSDNELEYIPYDLKIKVLDMKDKIKLKKSKTENIFDTDSVHQSKKTKDGKKAGDKIDFHKKAQKTLKHKEISGVKSNLKSRYIDAEHDDVLNFSARENYPFNDSFDSFSNPIRAKTNTNFKISFTRKDSETKNKPDQIFSDKDILKFIDINLDTQKQRNAHHIHKKIKKIKNALEETKRFLEYKLSGDILEVFKFREIGDSALRILERQLQVIKKSVGSQTFIPKSNTPNSQAFNMSKTQEYSKPSNLKLMLRHIYSDEQEFETIDVNTRRELARAMQGHDPQGCKDICPHLLRAMAIRARSRGIPYPLKHPQMPLI